MFSVPLPNGTVIVDDCDADLFDPWADSGSSSWFINSRGYVLRTRPRRERLHRVIMQRMKGRKLKRGELVDHINGNKLDNTRDNLRLANHSQNQANRGPSKGRRYKGVYRSQAEKAGWVAKITVDGEQQYLGTFSSPKEAAAAYDAAAREHFGEFAQTNFSRGNVGGYAVEGS